MSFTSPLELTTPAMQRVVGLEHSSGNKEFADHRLLLDESDLLSVSLPASHHQPIARHSYLSASPESTCSSRSSSFDEGLGQDVRRDRLSLSSCDSAASSIDEIMKVAPVAAGSVPVVSSSCFTAMDTLPEQSMAHSGASTGGETGFFDNLPNINASAGAELNDLQIFLETEPAILTPASTPEDQALGTQNQEWIYLEAAQPLPPLAAISSNQHQELQQAPSVQPGIVVTEPLLSPSVPLLESGSGTWQQSTSVGVTESPLYVTIASSNAPIKSEPVNVMSNTANASSPNSVYPFPVHLVKREPEPQFAASEATTSPSFKAPTSPNFSGIYASTVPAMPALALPVEPPASKRAPGKISRENSVASEPESPRLCHVCGEKAGKHSYYGGQVCPSCRAFFRRSVQSKYSDIYTCNKNQNCEITLKTRKNCQYCRFKLCEAAGMKRSWVLADGERRTTAPNSTHGADKDMERRKVPLSPEDKESIKDLVKRMNLIKHQSDEIESEVMSEISDSIVNKQSSLSSEGRRKLEKVLEQRARLFALNTKEFTTLSQQDQNALLAENTGTLVKFRMAALFRPDLTWQKQMDLVMGQSDVAKLSDKLVTRAPSNEERLEYEQVFQSPWTGSLDCEVDHKRMFQKIGPLIEDDVTFCLLSLILLFSGLHLSDNGKLYDSHVERYVGLLQRHLRSKHSASVARNKLAESVQIISHCRELAEVSRSC